MGTYQQPKRVRIAKIIASTYFIGFAAINVIGGLLTHTFNWVDLLILLVLCLPIIINKRQLYLLFGVCLSLLSAVVALLVIAQHVRFVSEPHKIIHSYVPSTADIVVGYMVTISSLICALLFVYVGLHPTLIPIERKQAS